MSGSNPNVAGRFVEFSGVLTSGTIPDGTAVTNTGSSTSPTTSAYSTTLVYDLVLTGVGYHSDTAPTSLPGGSWANVTWANNSTICGVQAEYILKGTVGAQSASWTISDLPWVTCLGALKLAQQTSTLSGATHAMGGGLSKTSKKSVSSATANPIAAITRKVFRASISAATANPIATLIKKVLRRSLNAATQATSASVGAELQTASSITNNWLLNLATGEDTIHGLIWAENKLWIGTQTIPAKVIRIDPSDPENYDVLTFANDGHHKSSFDLIYIASKGKIYVTFLNTGAGNPMVISEVDPDTLEYTDVISTTSYNQSQSLASDGTYLYVGCYDVSTTNGKLTRWLLSDWSAQGSVDIGFSDALHTVRYDGTNIFFTVTGYSKIFRVDLTSFTISQSANFQGGDTTPTDDLAFTTDYVWCGCENDGVISRIKKSDLTFTRIVTSISRATYAVYYANGYIWVAYALGTPGEIVRIDPNDLTLKYYVFTDESQTSPNEIVADDSGTMYFTFYVAPGIVSSAPSTLTAITQSLTAATSAPGGNLSSVPKKHLSAAIQALAAVQSKVSHRSISASLLAQSATVKKQTQRALESFFTFLNASVSAVTKVFHESFSAATAQFSVSLKKASAKSLLAAKSSWAATLARSKPASLVAATVAMAGAVTRKISVSKAAATSAYAGALSAIKSLARSFDAATAAFSASLIKLYKRSLAASMTAFAGSLARKALHVFTAATAAPIGALLRLVKHTLSGSTSALAAAITTLKAFTAYFSAATATMAAALPFLASKKLSAVTQAPSAIQSRRVSRILAAVLLAQSASITKQTRMALAAFFTFFGASISGVTAATQQSFFAATAAFSAGLTKFSKEDFIASTAALSGSLIKTLFEVFNAATVAFAGARSSLVKHALNAASTASSVVFNAAKGAKIYTKDISASTVSFSVNFFRKTAKVISAASSALTASLTKSSTRSESAQTQVFAAILSRKTEKALSAATAALAAVLTLLRGWVLTAALPVFQATLSRSFYRQLLASTQSMAGALSRISKHGLTAAMSTFSAVVDGIKNAALKTQDLTASMASFAAALSRRTGKGISSATASLSAIINKLTQRVMQATTAQDSAALPRLTGKGLAAATSAESASLLEEAPFMGTLMSVATGNFTSSSTWATVDSTSYLDSQAAQSAISTSNVDSQTFVPGAITVDGVAVKVAARAATPVGTFTVTLRNSTDSVNVASVAINVSDITYNSTSTSAFGWYFVYFGPQTLIAGKSYLVRVVCSNTGTQVTLYRNATVNNISRMLRTTTNAAPAAGDQLQVIGQWSGAVALTSYTVTMDNTATTSFGPTVAGGPPQGMVISKGGTLTFGTAASTNYYLKLKGVCVVAPGGTLNIGTSGTPIPATSTAVWEMDSVVNVDSNLLVHGGATCNIYGASKAVISTLLTANVAASGTVLQVVSTSGWAAGDQLALAPTTRTNTEAEKRTIQTVDSGVQVTLTAGVTNAHSGTSPTQGEVINLTRNVKIRGVSASLQGSVRIYQEATFSSQYAEYYQLGSGAANFRGINVQTTGTGTCLIQYCSVHDNTVTGSMGFEFDQNNWGGAGVTIENNVLYNISSTAFDGQEAPTSGTVSFQNNTIIRATVGMQFTAVTGSMQNPSGSSIAACGETVLAGNALVYTISSSATAISWSNLTVHSNNAIGLQCNNSPATAAMITMTGFKVWRNTLAGIRPGAAGIDSFNLTLENCTFFGNIDYNIQINAGCNNLILKNISSNGDSSFSTLYGLALNTNGGLGQHCTYILMQNCNFSTASGILTAHTADIDVHTASTFVQLFGQHNVLAAATKVRLPSNMLPGSYIGIGNLGQVDGAHKRWFQNGTVEADAAIYHTAAPSERSTPTTAFAKLESSPKRKVVANGQTVTFSVYIRQSVVGDGAAYNGNAPRLILRSNYGAGITSDVVLDTAALAAGSWEQLTGSSTAVWDDAVLECIVDCDGTAGWVNVDDWT
jgi:hypothetical protein